MLSRIASTAFACSLWLQQFACGDNKATDVQSSCEATIDANTQGRVFVDNDGDGVFSDGDSPTAGAIVFFEGERCTVTDAQGRYAMRASDRDGIVWVRGEDGWRPGPHWTLVTAGKLIAVDFAIQPRATPSPFSFIAASDTHAGIDLMSVEDQILGLGQAVSRADPAAFIVVTGDLTQSNKPAHFEALRTAISSIDTPFVPVPGNHDWYDGGAAYRSVFGPPSYSFNSGRYHFVVLNDAEALERRLAFLDLDRSSIERTRDVVVMMHAPPREDLRVALDDRNISMLLTGHMHANRTLFHDTFIEYNTQPLVMGGIDMTPGGFRVFRENNDSELEIDHGNIVNGDITATVSPQPGLVSRPCRARVIVSTQRPSEVVSVVASVDGVGDVDLRFRGGWTWASDELPLCTPGSFPVSTRIESADGSSATLSEDLVIGDPPTLAPATNWSMFQGGPLHQGASASTLQHPGRTVWTNHVDGNIHGGSPIVHNSRVVVSVSDFADGSQGGVVAFDLATGDRLWEYRAGTSVPQAAAASGARVLFISNEGVLTCLDIETGARLWSYEFAPGWPSVQRNLYSSPTIVGDRVYAGGRHEFAAFDIASGNVLWSIEPFTEFGDLSSHASPAVSEGVVVIPFNRRGGLYAYDTEFGTELWSAAPEVTLGVQATPVIANGKVYVLNELMQLAALDLHTGEMQWQRTVEAGAFGWGYLSSATPTVGDGQIFIATQRGALIAVDVDSGTKQWTFEADPSLIRATHYHGRVPALSAAVTSTPGRVWVPSTDGTLRVLDSSDGSELARVDLGLPSTSSLAIVDEVAIVATFDGTVRAITSAPTRLAEAD